MERGLGKKRFIERVVIGKGVLETKGNVIVANV